MSDHAAGAREFWFRVTPFFPVDGRVGARQLPYATRELRGRDYGRRGGPCAVCGKRVFAYELVHARCSALAERLGLWPLLMRRHEPAVADELRRCLSCGELAPYSSFSSGLPSEGVCDRCLAG